MSTNYPSAESWFVVDYDRDWFGLKGGDGVCRGVPEGTRQDWSDLISGIRAQETEVWVHRRLAYSKEQGVHSPRNSNEDVCFHCADPTQLADILLVLLESPWLWAPSHLPEVRSCREEGDKERLGRGDGLPGVP